MNKSYLYYPSRRYNGLAKNAQTTGFVYFVYAKAANFVVVSFFTPRAANRDDLENK